MRKMSLALPLVLAACASPYEICVANANKDIRVLDDLIAQARENIARGYGIRSETSFSTEKQVCGENAGKPVYCEVAVPDTVEVPVAIDLKAEQKKLQSLQATRQKKLARASVAARQCRARYPAG